MIVVIGVLSCKARSVHTSSLSGDVGKKITYSSIDVPIKKPIGLTLDAQSRLAFVTSESGETALVDIDQGRSIWHNTSQSQEAVAYGEFSPSGDLIAVTLDHRIIAIVDSKTGREVSRLKPPCIGAPYGVYYSKITWSKDQRLVAAAQSKPVPLPERERVINVWDTQTGDCVMVMPAIGNTLSIGFSNDSKLLLAFSQDTQFTIYDLFRKTIKTIKIDDLNFPFDTYGAFFDAKVSFRNDARLAVFGWNKSIGEAGNIENPHRPKPILVAVDLETGKKIWQREWVPAREQRESEIKSVEFDSSGSRIGLYINPGRWFVVNAINGEIVNSFGSDGKEPTLIEFQQADIKVPFLSFSKNLEKFFNLCADGKLLVWTTR